VSGQIRVLLVDDHALVRQAVRPKNSVRVAQGNRILGESRTWTAWRRVVTRDGRTETRVGKRQDSRSRARNGECGCPAALRHKDLRPSLFAV